MRGAGERGRAAEVMRNEMVKYRKQPYAGGKAIAGSTQVDLMDVADGVLLQWYGPASAVARSSLAEAAVGYWPPQKAPVLHT